MKFPTEDQETIPAIPHEQKARRVSHGGKYLMNFQVQKLSGRGFPTGPSRVYHNILFQRGRTGGKGYWRVRTHVWKTGLEKRGGTGIWKI